MHEHVGEDLPPPVQANHQGWIHSQIAADDACDRGSDEEYADVYGDEDKRGIVILEW